METKPQNNTINRLSAALQENASQLLRGDAEIIAGMVELSHQGVRPYLKGEVSNFDTGIKILGAIRSLIMEREKKVNKAVA